MITRRIARLLLAAATATAGLTAAGAGVAAGPAAALLPPQPPGCGYHLGPVSTQGAAGTLILVVTLQPAAPYQHCTAATSVTASVAGAGGATPAGIASDLATDAGPATFVPSQLPPAAYFAWAGYCTTVPQPVYLTVQAGSQRTVTPLGTSASCASKGGPGFTSTFRGGNPPLPAVSVVGLAPDSSGTGYRLTDQSGFVQSRGTPATQLLQPSSNFPVVGIAAAPSSDGNWLVAADGGVFTYGTAAFYGSTGAMHLNAPIVGMAPTHDGGGYWLVAADGGVFSFGDATFHGSTGALHLNAPVVGMAATPDGGGYWLVAADGGVFSFGDAAFHGSAGALALHAPVVGMAASRNGGYWLVAADGGVFSFGSTFYGSAAGLHLAAPIAGMAPTANSTGYWLVGADGGVFTFGSAPFYASAARP